MRFPTPKQLFEVYASGIESNGISNPKSRASGLKPRDEGTIEHALGWGLSLMAYSLVLLIRQVFLNGFASNAPRPVLDAILARKNVFFREATPSVGWLMVQGTDSVEIASNTQFTGGGVTVVTLTSATIQANNFIFTANPQDGSAGTYEYRNSDKGLHFTTVRPHNFSNISGFELSFRGSSSNLPRQNSRGDVIDHRIEITGERTFKLDYVFSEAADLTNVSSITLSIDYTRVLVQSLGAGITSNLPGGTTMVSGSTFPNAGVDWNGLIGGLEPESVSSFRQRGLSSLAVSNSHFTENSIRRVITSLGDFSHILIITPNELIGSDDPNSVSSGQLKIHLLNRAIPYALTEAETTRIRDTIIAELGFPPFAVLDEFTVNTLSTFDVNVNISSITPDTPSMRREIEGVIRENITQSGNLNELVDIDLVRGWVSEVTDPETGVRISSIEFGDTPLVQTLPVDSPTGSVPKLGEVVWS